MFAVVERAAEISNQLFTHTGKQTSVIRTDCLFGVTTIDRPGYRLSWPSIIGISQRYQSSSPPREVDQAALSFNNAEWRRLLTVPTGTSNTSAASRYFNP